MASDQEFVDFIVGQMKEDLEISSRKMFGEYAVYCKKKVVALICDNQLYVKPTQAGKAFIGEVIEAPPYPGAKCSYLIEEQIENSEWLSELVQITYQELPEPKPKKKKKAS